MEEEIIERIKYLMKDIKHRKIDCQAIQGLLDLYNKEKEKNKKAIQYIKETSRIEVGEAPNGKMMYDYNLNIDEILPLLELLEE